MCDALHAIGLRCRCRAHGRFSSLRESKLPSHSRRLENNKGKTGVRVRELNNEPRETPFARVRKRERERERDLGDGVGGNDRERKPNEKEREANTDEKQ